MGFERSLAPVARRETPVSIGCHTLLGIRGPLVGVCNGHLQRLRRGCYVFASGQRNYGCRSGDTNPNY